MRFHANGPIIPEELLSQQRDGNVIFFCGAGVSMPAGLPSFKGLTKQIIDDLKSDKADGPYNSGEYDRAFSALYREFDALDVNRKLYSALKTPKDAELKLHRCVLDLSRGADGSPQIVTTNFDLLFERAEKNIKYSVPPNLPDLDYGQSVNGLIYLHGRLLRADSNRTAGYVVSSSDFGRAYLSEGWAAKFIKGLREKYTIVLLGYRAEDPPMRYLLEGLNKGKDQYATPLYAFTEEHSDDEAEEWHERGVTPISYENETGNHAVLWATLESWSEAAKDPDGWTQKVISLARIKPAELQPFQRGQVTNLISSAEGAKAFADAKPEPDAEWLCVFDPYVRYADIYKPIGDDDEGFDPMDLYGLDDDPPRPIKESNSRPEVLGKDFLAWNSRDDAYPERTHFAAWEPEWSSRIPKRLHHLGRWFQSVLDKPAVIWWAAGRMTLHPSILWFVSRRLENKNGNLPEHVRFFWNVFIANADLASQRTHDLRWYALNDIVKMDGWNSFAIQKFEKISEPFIEIKRYSCRSPRAPQKDWANLNIKQVVDYSVRVLDRHNHKIEISDEYLPSAVARIRSSLERTALLLDEINTIWWSTPTLYPTGERGEHFHGKKAQYFLWFKELFERLIQLDPALAKREYRQWSKYDSYFFAKLSLYVCKKPEIVPIGEAYSFLESLPEDIFWNSYHQRELLFLLRDRWQEFSLSRQRKIESRLARGSPKWPNEDDERYHLRKASSASERLRWLQINNCELSNYGAKKLEKLTAVDPKWIEELAQNADDSRGPRGGYVKRDTDPQGLQVLSIDQVVEAAQAKTRDEIRELRDYRPFSGLVAEAPFRALSALRYSLKKSEFPYQFWRNLLSDWPDDVPARLNWLLAYTISRLTPAQAIELKYYIPDWIHKNLKKLVSGNRADALRIFDEVVKPYVTASGTDVSSSMGETRVGGVVQDRSEVSINKAINSPVGKLAESLWQLVPRGRKNRKMPKYLTVRFELLFSLPNPGGGHAATVVATHLGWLDYWFRDWVTEKLLDLFEFDNPLAEAAWHGLAYDRNGLSHETLISLNQSFLAILQRQPAWQLDEQEYRHHVRRMVYLSQPDLKYGAVVSSNEANQVLKSVDDLGRSEAIFALRDIVEKKGKWNSFVKPFIKNTWPKQNTFKSDKTTRAFIHLLQKTEKNFGDAVKIVLPLMRAVANPDLFGFWYSTNDHEGEFDYARNFPAEVLSLLNTLIGDDKMSAPYGLSEALNAIAEAKPPLRQSLHWKRLSELTL